MSKESITEENITKDNIRRLVEEYIDDNNPRNLKPISEWDVSNVTDMQSVFYGYSDFNEPLNRWDVSKVTNMDGTFYGCNKFNQPLNDWNVSNVTNMRNMFEIAPKMQEENKPSVEKYNQYLAAKEAMKAVTTKKIYDGTTTADGKKIPKFLPKELGDLITSYAVNPQDAKKVSEEGFKEGLLYDAMLAKRNQQSAKGGKTRRRRHCKRKSRKSRKGRKRR
jgi:surface protein